MDDVHSRVGPYAGVWARASLEEPAGTAAPSNARCLWLQTPSGRFVDVRVPPGGDSSPSSLRAIKSFAGLAALTATPNGERLMTWTRRIDIRAPGPADMGIVRDLDADTIEELSFLPGDDYREVWRRVEAVPLPSLESQLPPFIACDLRGRLDQRQGYFVQVGSWWGLAVGRPPVERGVELLRAFFEGGADTAAVDFTAEYVCAVGRTSRTSLEGRWQGGDAHMLDYSIEYCTDARLVGMSLVETATATTPATPLVAAQISTALAATSDEATSLSSTSAPPSDRCPASSESADLLASRFRWGTWDVTTIEGELPDCLKALFKKGRPAQ